MGKPSEVIDRRTFLVQSVIGMSTLPSLLGFSKDSHSQDSLLKEVLSSVNQRAKSAGISVDEKLVEEVTINIHDNYRDGFIQENLTAIGSYIINMHLSGWTHKSFSDYRTQ